ncbi:MAG: hypothetical protein LC126_10860 [Bryobacterales bacterium]|nr:hypothetical protein [Bryobacterales bacterium]
MRLAETLELLAGALRKNVILKHRAARTRLPRHQTKHDSYLRSHKMIASSRLPSRGNLRVCVIEFRLTRLRVSWNVLPFFFAIYTRGISVP